MNRLFFLPALLLCLFSFDLSAQMVAKSPLAAAASIDAKEITVNDWSIYSDMESSTYFIDFEQLSVNVNKVLVKSATGEIVWEEDVFDLPVNSIYELDFTPYTSGEYIIELQAFTGVVRKKVSHKA